MIPTGYGPAIEAVAAFLGLAGVVTLILWVRRRIIRDTTDRINAQLAKAQAEDAKRKAEASEEVRRIAEDTRNRAADRLSGLLEDRKPDQ